MSDLSELSISGRVVQPGDAEWEAARVAWNLVVDQRPTAVARVQSTDDVAAVLRFAAANGLRVVAQGTGHGAPSLGSLEDTLLIKTDAMHSVEVDRDARTARLGAGAIAEQVASAAHAGGLSSLPGSRRASAPSASRSVAGSVGWDVATASPAIGSPRSSS